MMYVFYLTGTPVDLAIYEFGALLLAVPLSYLMAKWIKTLRGPSWEDEVNATFQKHWSGKPEDELYAWMKARNEFQSFRRGKKKHLHRIEQEIKYINRRKIYSEKSVTEEGIIE